MIYGWSIIKLIIQMILYEFKIALNLGQTIDVSCMTIKISAE